MAQRSAVLRRLRRLRDPVAATIRMLRLRSAIFRHLEYGFSRSQEKLHRLARGDLHHHERRERRQRIAVGARPKVPAQIGVDFRAQDQTSLRVRNCRRKIVR